MEEGARTFSSESNEYNLNLSSKDHISSPSKKKHSMMLNLGSKSSNVFGADQTPTPTRFIRNCEEVGLFQDLQNVNPFEETFRKAVESGKTGSLALQSSRLSVVTDDTLHTPHVFPHIIENELVSKCDAAQKLQLDRTGCEEGEMEERVGMVRPAVKVVRQEADTSQLRPIAPSLRTNPMKPVCGVTQPVQLILQMPDGRLMQLNATPLDSNKKSDLQGPVDLVARVDKYKSEVGSVILHTGPEKKQESDNISPLIKEKLKARLGSTGMTGFTDKSVNSDDQRAKVGQKEEGSRNKRSSSISNASNSEDDEETKRRRFLERNRAAAMRCREKRKFWVATLERRAEQMLSTNQQLQLEVGALRAEVAHLKTLLLAHKDCPVTQAMYNNHQISTAPVVFPVEVEASGVIKSQASVTPVHMVKPISLSGNETAFWQNVKKKLRTVTIKKSVKKIETEGHNRDNFAKKKRLSLDIESAKQSQCLEEVKSTSPHDGSDEYLGSTLLQNDSLELESVSKPVATQVIQVNPNVLYRDSLRLSPPNMDTPLLPISPNPNCIDYS